VTHVLALRALGLGDLLTAVPALRGLRRAWPRSRLTLAGPEALGLWLVSLGVVDDVVPLAGLVDCRRLAGAVRRPAVAVNLHGRGPQSHHLLARLEPGRLVAFANPDAGHEGPPWRADEHEVDRWIRLSASAGGAASPEDLRLPDQGARARHVVVHPGAASTSRCWPTERWAAVAEALAEQGHEVVVTGSRAETSRCAAVAGPAAVEDRSGRESFAALARTVGTARLVLSGDTGVAHLATAFATPSVTLFGPVSPALWGPRIDRHLHRVLWHGRPEDLHPGDPHGEALDERLAAIRVDDVLGAAAGLLDGGQAVRVADPVASPAASHWSSSDA
jgi:ADP-heptose:LPS heptosyltransferase